MDLLEHLIARPGETQEGRRPEGLARGFVQVEDRSSADLYRLAAKLAANVRFHYVQGGAIRDDLDWTPFFPVLDTGGLPKSRDGKTPPHLALFAAFLKLHRIPRAAMNGITARHLDFFYRRVLGFAPRPPKPDRAHLLIELKKTAAPAAIGPAQAFSGGKDASGTELVYAPLATTIVNRAKVENLSSVYVDPAGGGTVRFAPVADSADGLGGELEGEAANWRAFGYPDLPPAPVGFALASPVLRMKEGMRKIRLELQLEGLTATLAGALDSRLQAFVTAPKRWLGPYEVDATPSGERLAIEFTVPADDEAVADYDPAKHGLAFATRLPVVQLLLRDSVAHGYADLQRPIVRAAKIAVEVSGVKSLQLESDAGALDPRRAFHPFGPQPMPGSRFMVGCAEALAKKLEELTLELHWLGLPPDFAERYTGYRKPLPAETDFGVRVALRDGAGRETSSEEIRPLFQPREGNAVRLRLVPGAPRNQGTSSPAKHVRALAAGGSLWLAKAAQRATLKQPMFRLDAGPPAARAGFITLKLDGDLRHGEYRAKLVKGEAPDNEPYTPALGELSLSYKAASDEAQIDSRDDAAVFTGAEVELFHVGCFGQRREHAWLREQLAFVAAKRVPLFPEYEDEGELLIGLGELAAGDSVSLLFKVAEGSADPEVDPQPQVRWAVLCDNYWKALAGREAVRDGTNNLLATGIVHLTIPTEASTLSSFFPTGRIWVKASIREHVNGVCALVDVAANAIEVERRSAGAAALPGGKIVKLKTPLAAVKAVAQPFASFGGTAPESADAMNTRVAERLRHRNRCISAWDYERSVLEAFPELRKVKCIPHSAGREKWLDPGHVAIVVVPDLRNLNAVDPLQPRADAGTLSRVRAHLEARAPMNIRIHPMNPRYQRVRLDFKVRFRPGIEFNFYARQLRGELIDHLSPWARDPGRPIAFGGTVYKSELLDFVEDLDYVDYLTDFRMYDLRGGASDTEDVNEARAATPDAILVSDATHDIAPVP